MHCRIRLDQAPTLLPSSRRARFASPVHRGYQANQKSALALDRPAACAEPIRARVASPAGSQVLLASRLRDGSVLGAAAVAGLPDSSAAMIAAHRSIPPV